MGTGREDEGKAPQPQCSIIQLAWQATPSSLVSPPPTPLTCLAWIAFSLVGLQTTSSEYRPKGLPESTPDEVDPSHAFHVYDYL